MTDSQTVDSSEIKDMFSVGDFVVYPTHGVGQVTCFETQRIAGQKIRLIVVNFDKDQMILRVPVDKVPASGLRRLSTRRAMKMALATLGEPPIVKRMIWKRRADEYSTKINSGDPVSIAEVVRDLHRQADQPQASYSAQMLYEKARDRLTLEVAEIDNIRFEAATIKLDGLLNAA